jgi:hypothetical protein
MLNPPMYPRKQVKCFGDMSKNDSHETSCAQQLLGKRAQFSRDKTRLLHQTTACTLALM